MPNLHGNFSAKTVTETVVNVPGNAWSALPTTAQVGRNYMEVLNKGENKLYLSFDNVDSNGATRAVVDRGAIGGGETRGLPIQDNLTLFGRSDPNVGGTRVIVTEYR